MGQQSKDFALPEERLSSVKISEGRREECATPSTGRMAGFAFCPRQQTLNIAVLDVYTIRPTKFHLSIRDHIYAGVGYSITYDGLILLFCGNVR